MARFFCLLLCCFLLFCFLLCCFLRHCFMLFWVLDALCCDCFISHRHHLVSSCLPCICINQPCGGVLVFSSWSCGGMAVLCMF
ncbi:hypothetical protein N658DRAFT_134754 [Parathielavia hyrcaniae]|uniref:Uncharacterized protein n=1 Tax=Parathielavia hyrcaniae TaxID=113614 RepID=A0AAN6Q8X4_9PEZI|nr:hypothetical protein N658DRAFT_134754 [Parathielavia hyrcaniae]